MVAIAGWRTPPASGSLGLDLAMTYQPDASLEIAPAGRVLSGTAMKPGEAVSGSLTARNITGVTLPLRVRALPSIADLNRSLMIHIGADGHSLYDGPLGGVHGSLKLRSGATANVHVTATLPRGATNWQGRIAKVVLELR